MEAAKRIRRLVPHTKLLFVSQESDSDVVQETFRLGARGYVHKPLAPSDPLPAIQAVLRGKRFVSSGLKFRVSADAQHRHEVQFYSDDSVFLKSSTRFIADALTTADAAIVLATNSHREGLVRRLKADGFDIDGAIQQGTCISLDAVDTLSTIMVNGLPDPVRFSTGLGVLIESAAKASETEHPRIAIFGECVGVLFAEGNPNAAISLEKIGNDLVKTHGVDILCAYPCRMARKTITRSRASARSTQLFIGSERMDSGEPWNSLRRFFLPTVLCRMDSVICGAQGWSGSTLSRIV